MHFYLWRTPHLTLNMTLTEYLMCRTWHQRTSYWFGIKASARTINQSAKVNTHPICRSVYITSYHIFIKHSTGIFLEQFASCNISSQFTEIRVVYTALLAMNLIKVLHNGATIFDHYIIKLYCPSIVIQQSMTGLMLTDIAIITGQYA